MSCARRSPPSRGYAELLRKDALTDDSDTGSGPLPASHKEAARMGALVGDLAILAREGEGPVPARHRVDLAAVAAEAVADAKTLDATRPIALHASAEVPVSGDDARLEQMVHNLIGNALAHTPTGTPVEVGVAVHGSHAILEVRDRGPGMSPDQARHVFDRFYRGDGDRLDGGSGLGLYIVATLARTFGGTASVDTEVGVTDRPSRSSCPSARTPWLPRRWQGGAGCWPPLTGGAARRSRCCLLHGQPGSGTSWDPVTDLLAPEFRVLAPDRVGYGASVGEARGLAANADLIAEFISAEGAAPATVVAHSWAGGVAVLLAARRPDAVSNLVLVGGVHAGQPQHPRSLAHLARGGRRPHHHRPAGHRGGAARASAASPGGCRTDIAGRWSGTTRTGASWPAAGVPSAGTGGPSWWNSGPSCRNCPPWWPISAGSRCPWRWSPEAGIWWYRPVPHRAWPTPSPALA